ncbi:MAG: PIN domain-containing protein [Candidatus Methanofastidiosia archaeon]
MTDTHALVWYILDTLPEAVDKVFKSAEKGESTIFIPTIVVAECFYLMEKGKINFNFDDVLKRIEMSKNFISTSFDFHVVTLLPEIKVGELHDRIIVVTAKILNARSITKDKKRSGAISLRLLSKQTN